MIVELFGFTFTKYGLTKNKALDIMSLLNSRETDILKNFSRAQSGESVDLNVLSSLFGESGDMSELSGMMNTAGMNFEKLITGIGELLAE